MFIYTLNFLFAHTQLISPLDFWVIMVILYTLLYFTTPYPEKAVNIHPLPKGQLFLLHIQAALNGEKPLARVFWPYFLILNLGLIIADSLAVRSSISVSSWDDILLLAASSSILWTFSVWRCSWQTSNRTWAALARLMTLCAFIDYGLRIFILIDFPSEFFNCEGILLDYSTCF